MHQEYVIGNAEQESLSHRGWIIGHFIEPSDIRFSKDVEIKFSKLPKGTSRETWSINQTAHTISLVISGELQVILKGEVVNISENEYFLSRPGVAHKYVVRKDAVILTVRWPSLPNDHTNCLELAPNSTH